MDKYRINLGKIKKAARWMDLKDENGAKVLLNEVVKSALATDNDPISFCEAHLFLSEIDQKNNDISSAKKHLQEVINIEDDRADDAKSRARHRLTLF